MERNEQSDKLQQRLIDFAVRIMRLADRLPRTTSGRHVAGQITRCGTSPAPNYGEARAAESYMDFVHKLGVVLKELNETLVWLQMIKQMEWIDARLLQPLIDENLAVCKIFTASSTTAKAKLRGTRVSKNDKRQMTIDQ